MTVPTLSGVFEDLLPKGSRRVLLYCPEAMVAPHFMQLQLLGRLLQEEGHEVFTTHCGALFRRCLAMESIPLPSTAPPELRAHVCQTCDASFRHLVTHTPTPFFNLGQAIPSDSIARVSEMLDAMADEELSLIVYDGVPFGQMCRAEMLTTCKLMSGSPLQPEHYLYLRQFLSTTIASYAGMLEFLPTSQITDVFTYGDYASNLCVFAAAKKLGINWGIIHNLDHLQQDRRRLLIFHGTYDAMREEIIARWPLWRGVPLKANDLAEIALDIRIRLGGTGFATYSKARSLNGDVLAELGLDRSKKLLVAYTSSLDEFNSQDVKNAALGWARQAKPGEPYLDQVSWLKALIGRYGDRDDVQLVIRIHPREDVNKRDSVASQHFVLLKDSLVDLPPGVRVIWPSDPVSSYDLMEAADAVAVWISMMGLEAARLGVPVIKTFHDFPAWPAGDFAVFGKDEPAYFTAIDGALQAGPDFDGLLAAWRFYGYSRFAWSYDYRDVVQDVGMREIPPYQRPAQIEEILAGLFSKAETIDIKARRAQAHAHHERLTADQEATLVRHELARIVGWLVSGSDTAAAPRLLVPRDTDHDDIGEGAVRLRGAECTMRLDGALHSKVSPMVARLARMVLPGGDA